jgi:hypothetical protein
MEYYSAIKKNGIMSLAGKGEGTRDHPPVEGQYHMFSLLYRV